MARFFISAAHKSSGKTTLSLGLSAALRLRGLAVQPFKKGPDYIDPLWLTVAAGRTCRNLDHHTMSDQEIIDFYHRHAAGADVAVIEGNKGLHDGVDLNGRDSSAGLARLLKAPVLLVIDAGGITRGIAPLLMGYQQFDPEVKIGGVILNKVSGPRHESKLRAAVEHYTDIPVLGAVYRSADVAIDERHLGLIPANEASESQAKITAIATAIAQQVDLDRVLDMARAAPGLPAPAAKPVVAAVAATRRVGIARDAAFGFYYAEDIEALKAEGFSPVYFDTMNDRQLPRNLDGLFIGGGFPETHMDALTANDSLRHEIRAAITGGMPVYAECGGMMYLTRSITWNGKTCAMVGALDADTVMNPRPQGRGYVRLRETAASLWSKRPDDAVICGHEFHYAGLQNLSPDTRFAYDVVRGYGIDGHHDGMVKFNTLASFAHLRGVGTNPWPQRFAGFMRQCSSINKSMLPLRAASPVQNPFITSPTGDFISCPIVKPSTPAIHSAPAP